MKKLFFTVLPLLVAFAAGAQVYETVHFHFDKDVYLPGETVWFKAYQYNNNRPGITSTNLYTALYTEQGRLLQQKQYPFFESTASGDFQLPDSVAGNFIFRAFTKTMLQQDSANVYYQVINIAGAPPYPHVSAGNARLEFFPEGGELVAGLPNFTGLRSSYKGGRPVSVTGVIKDGGTEAASFETGPAGMTVLQWTPEAGRSYTAFWTTADGQQGSTVLPPVKSSGVLLHTEFAGGKIFYMVSKNSAAEDLSTLYLQAQQGADTVYRAELRMDKAEKTVNSFSTGLAASGLVRILLQSRSGQVLADETCYINGDETPLVVTVKQLEPNAGPRKKNVIEIALSDTVKATLSVSIADAAFYTGQKASIAEGLLMGNAVKSGVQLPLSGDTANTGNPALYTLNRKWPGSVATNRQAAPADDYLDLQFSSSSRKPEPGEQLTALINDKVIGRQFVNIQPAANTFSGSGLVFYDSAKIYYQLQKNKNMVDEIKPVPPAVVQSPAFIVPPVLYQPAAVKPSATAVPALFTGRQPGNFNSIQTLQEVKVKSRFTNTATKRLQELDQKYASGQFRGIARGFQINVADDPDAENEFDIYNYIVARVVGLAVYTTSGGGKSLIRLAESRINPQSPMLFLDEVEITNDVLQTVPITRIAYIKYIPGIVIGSFFQSTQGALFVYTKKGDELPPPKNMRFIKAKGYNLANVFTQPDYSSMSAGQADNRSTLYWNPYVLMDTQNRKFTVEYYNNDLSKKLLLVIEGMDEKGRLVHAEKLIE